MSTTYAVIVAVETYQFDNESVAHALADANGFRDVLVKDFGIAEGDISSG